MKAIVVYESHWGNTAAIARAIAEGIGQELTELRYGSHVYRLPPSGSDAGLPAAA